MREGEEAGQVSAIARLVRKESPQKIHAYEGSQDSRALVNPRYTKDSLIRLSVEG